MAQFKGVYPTAFDPAARPASIRTALDKRYSSALENAHLYTMSWIEKELRRRTVNSQLSTPQKPDDQSDLARMQELWEKLKAANSSLPAAIQLQTEGSSSFPASVEEINFVEWLRAPNGAALGFSGIAVRYVCPEKSERRSFNFWIRWDERRKTFVVNQRTSASIPPSVSAFRFNLNQTEYMIKCLVLGKRINSRSLRERRLWFF